MEIFQTVRKFPAGMVSFQTVWKVYRRSEKFPYSMEIFLTVWIYALLAHICRKNDLRTLSGKFLRVKFCQPESFDFLCLWGSLGQPAHTLFAVALPDLLLSPFCCTFNYCTIFFLNFLPLILYSDDTECSIAFGLENDLCLKVSPVT